MFHPDAPERLSSKGRVCQAEKRAQEHLNGECLLASVSLVHSLGLLLNSKRDEAESKNGRNHVH